MHIFALHAEPSANVTGPIGKQPLWSKLIIFSTCKIKNVELFLDFGFISQEATSMSSLHFHKILNPELLLYSRYRAAIELRYYCSCMQIEL